MDGNSSKPAETQNSQVSALRVALDWVGQEGGRQRLPSLTRELLEITLKAVERGESPPETDSLTLAALWQLTREGRSTAPGPPLRGSEMSNWWANRAAHLGQACRARGCEVMPHLVVHKGGGRHLPTRFAIGFVPVPDPEAEVEPEGEAGEPGHVGAISYRIDPARAAFWLRWFLGSRPFPINSWRGYVLVGSMLINLLLIGLMWTGVYLALIRPRPITTADLATLGLAGAITVGLWALTRPIRLIPTQRVTLAGPALLALNELYGQLRAMPDANRKGEGRTVSIVRHWGVCPICAADVDLDDGGAAFPDRLVGRCHDAPLEHVYSFDPVRLVGETLRITTSKAAVNRG